MARKVRIEFPGAIYHVMARGNERARIFHKEEDYLLFLETLESGLGQFNVKLRAYCLMPNHVHLVLETPQGNLSRMMAWLQTTFSVRYNRRHKRSGHLFQGRYRAELVENGSYGKWLLLYVHLNPVRTRQAGKARYHAGIRELNRFRWSSHRYYLGLEEAPIQGLDNSWLSEWGRSAPVARLGYKKAIENEMSSKEVLDWKSQLTMGLVAGGEDLLEKVKELLGGRGKERGAKEVMLLKKQGRAARLEPFLAKETDARVQIWARVRLLGERPVDLARERGLRDGGSILQVVKRLEKRSEKEEFFKKKLIQLQKVSRVDD